MLCLKENFHNSTHWQNLHAVIYCSQIHFILVLGILKNSLMLFDSHANLPYHYGNRH